MVISFLLNEVLNSLRQTGTPLVGFGIADCPAQRFSFTNDGEPKPCAGNCCVDDGTHQHDRVGAL